MANSFLQAASKQITDVRVFLRDAAGSNSIKYTAEKGAKHIIYIPYKTEVIINPETGEQTPIRTVHAIEGKIHEWTSQDGKFKAAHCLDGVVIKNDDGVVVNDGTCPFCDRKDDAWNIYHYRKELEEANCKLTGEQRKAHMEKALQTFADERKAKEARVYMYILVVKFNVNESGAPILGSDNLPEYELKVMKLSASRIEKIQQQIANSGSELPDSELIFEYPSVDDRRLLISQSTTAPVFPNNRITVKYPGLIDKINQDVSKFEWDGIVKAFPEWSGMSTEAARTITNNLFEKWDAYNKELTVNPNAKYLEYVVETPTTTPNLGGEGLAGAIPVIPNVPVAETPTPVVPNIPNIPVVPQAAPVVPPVVPQVDPNAVFAGQGAAAPTLTV